MTLNELIGVYGRKPFEPFILHLAGGRSVHVVGREFLDMDPKSRTVRVYTPDGTCHIIDLLLVADLEIPPAADDQRAEQS